MNADTLFSPTFPHGTPDGYGRGCHGSHCPAVIPCRVVYRRYAGDYSFRKMIDAGDSLEVILERDAEAARVARDALKRRPGPRAKAKPGDRRAEANRLRGGQPLIPRDTLKALIDEGLTDRQIAERLGLARRQVAGTRNNAGFPPNRDQKGAPGIDALLPTVAHLPLEEAAAALGRKPSYIKRRRQIAARNQTLATAGVSS